MTTLAALACGGRVAREGRRFEPILSTFGDAARMNDGPHTAAERLIDEVSRYLAAVDVFRAANCEPTWRPELAPSAMWLDAVERITPIEARAH